MLSLPLLFVMLVVLDFRPLYSMQELSVTHCAPLISNLALFHTAVFSLTALSLSSGYGLVNRDLSLVLSLPLLFAMLVVLDFARCIPCSSFRPPTAPRSHSSTFTLTTCKGARKDACLGAPFIP